MKKIFAIALALMLVMSMGTTAFAENATLTDETTSTTFDVNAKYDDTASAFAVISVDVEYGAMQFTYHDAGSTGTWNPATHTYDTSTPGQAEWRVDNDSNKIKVTNHSNRDVEVTVTGEQTISPQSWGDLTITGGTTTADKLNAGVENDYANASFKEYTMMIEGDINQSSGLSNSYVKIGEITVTIEPLDTVTTDSTGA